jgi:hypothetical protein
MKLKVNKAADVLSTAKIFQLLRSYKKTSNLSCFHDNFKMGSTIFAPLQKKVIKYIFMFSNI